MLFKGEEASLKLEIVMYELPGDAGQSSDDQNWLVMRGTWINENGELVKDSNACLLTYELTELTAGLKVLHAGIKDTYESAFTSPDFALAADSDGNGGFKMYVSFYLPNTMDGNDTAEVECSMSADELKDLINELDQLCAKFPDRI